MPGCDAKPILDILIARSPGEGFEEWRGLLAPLGFSRARIDSTGQGEGQWFFRDALRTIHVHVYEEGSPGHLRHLAFRDALRGDDALRDAYVALKRDLASREWASTQAYVDAKGAFVRDVERGFRSRGRTR